MSFTLKMSTVIVGRSELEHRDAARRVAHGAFRPGLGFDLVQPIFDLYDGGSDAAAAARYRKAREALRLQLTDSSGNAVSVREVHIRRDGATGSGTAGYVIEVETDDPAVWGASTAGSP